MKETLKRALLACPGFEALCRSLTAGHVRAVMYHRFCRDEQGDPTHLDQSSLVWQVRYLVRHHALWTPDKHRAALGGEWSGGRCPVVITVDDGYREFAEIAFPIFRTQNVPVMFFVTTDFVDGKLWFWWDKLTFVLENARPLVHEVDLPEERIRIDLTSDGGRASAWHQITDLGRILPDEEKEDLIGDVAKQLNVRIPEEQPERYRAVSWTTLGEMVEQGLLIGAHTRTHPILSRVDLDRARAEIYGSKDALERRLRGTISWFCYPQGGPGDYTRRVRNVVAEGFTGCYVAHQTPEDPGDPYTLPRYSASRDRLAFRWSLCGAEYLARRLRRFLDRSVVQTSEQSTCETRSVTMKSKRSEESP